MKLLIETPDITELERLQLLLESNGILIHVGNKDTARNLFFLPVFNRYAIHVVYDEQYTDARKLLEDENHVVENPVDISAIKQKLETQQDEVLPIIMRKLIMGIVVLLLLCASIIIYMENR